MVKLIGQSAAYHENKLWTKPSGFSRSLSTPSITLSEVENDINLYCREYWYSLFSGSWESRLIRSSSSLLIFCCQTSHFTCCCFWWTHKWPCHIILDAMSSFIEWFYYLYARNRVGNSVFLFLLFVFQIFELLIVLVLGSNYLVPLEQLLKIYMLQPLQCLSYTRFIRINFWF